MKCGKKTLKFAARAEFPN